MQPQKLILSSFFILLTSYFILLTPAYAQETLAPQSPPQVDDVGTPSATPYPELPPPETGFKLTVSPPVLDLQTAAGNPITAVVQVKSFTDHPEDIRVSLMKFVADETGEKAKLLELESTDLFPAWVSFSEDRFILEPETWKSISVTFSPPETAPPGQYFAIVFNRTKEVEFEGGQVAKGAAAILVLSQINSSRVHRQLDLALLDGNRLGFKTDKQVYEFLPVEFQTTLTNAGNVHEFIFGNIFIDWDTGGIKNIDTLTVNSDKSYTLPQTTRTFTNIWNNGFPHWETELDDANNPILDKNGNPKKKLVWDLSKLLTFRIGKYSATLIVAYNDGVRDIPIESQTSFWVIPWRILLVLLVIVILLGFGLKNLIQSAHKRIQRIRNRY